MAAEEDVAAGLIDWVNSLEVADRVESIQECSDGEAIWSLLHHIDNVAFTGNLPEDTTQFDKNDKDSWIRRWNNLKHIYQALEIYLIDEIGLDFPLFERNPDLQAIAQHDGREDIITLLKLCVVAAANCSNRIEFLQGMQHLEKPTQMVLMATLQATQPSDRSSEEDPADATLELEAIISLPDDEAMLRTAEIPPVTVKTTSNLAFEERLAKVIADNQRIAREKQDLQRHIDDLNSRHKSLQDSFNRAQEELGQTNDRLTAVLSGRAETTDKTAEARQETVIVALEARLAESEVELNELRKNTEVLKLKADRAQKLQDDYDEMKIERDKLSRKANAAEKYRVKLEAVQNMEQENTKLRTKVADLQAQLRHSDSSRASSSDLQREIDEYRRLLPNIEQERHEVNEMKKRLEFDYHALTARYSESEEQLRRSRQEIEDLQGRLRDYDDGYVPATLAKEDEEADGQTLEAEEAEFAAAEARLTEVILRTSTTRSDEARGQIEKVDIDNGVSEDELRAIMSAMRAQMQAGTAQERESGLQIQKKLVIMLEKIRSKNENLASHIQKQSELIMELRSKVQDCAIPNVAANKARAGKNDTDLEQQLDDQELLIDNLKREIRLISSAWYEQNQRIGSLGGLGANGIMALIRMRGGGLNSDGSRVEVPKSFLGKQRRYVDRIMTGTNIQQS